MAETMEDSGFDSDQKNINSGDLESPMRVSSVCWPHDHDKTSVVKCLLLKQCSTKILIFPCLESDSLKFRIYIGLRRTSELHQ